MATEPAPVFRYRFLFSKIGGLRFVGHLDFLRVLQKAARRAGLPMAYSGGFNPHMELSIALPLPVGMKGLEEIAEFSLREDIPAEDVLAALETGANLPEGARVLACRRTAGKPAAALVRRAAYEIRLPFTPDVNSIRDFLNQKEMIITHPSKSGEKTEDIRPDVFDLSACFACSAVEPVLKATLNAGSSRFCKPEWVVQALFGLEAAQKSRYARVKLFLDGES